MSLRTKLTILCENSVAKPGRLIGEHGFACLIETRYGSYLFDTGQGLGLLHNAQELGKDLTNLKGIVLSHGHYDHTGGLFDLLSHLRRPIDIYAHPDLFSRRFWRSEFELRAIDLPFTRQQLKELGGQFRLSKEATRLSEVLVLSGEIPRKNDFETSDPHLVVIDRDGAYTPDPLLDDLSMAIRTKKGLVILLGCAHAGVINIIEHLIELTGEDRLHAVIGGTHLGPAPEAQYHATVEALKRYQIDKIATSHCTGLGRASQLAREFPGHFLFASSGAVFEFD